jgi:hypothetical protein
MDLRVAIPEAQVKHEVLDAALEVPTRMNELMIKRGDVPPWEEALARGVEWRPEPPGAERFDHAATVLARGWGDCDDLAPYKAATLRVSGEDPGAQAVVMRTGPQRWHAVVMRSDGSIDDPSVDAGMLSRRGQGAAAMRSMQDASAVVGDMTPVRPRIALAPDPRGGFRARAEIPLYPDYDDEDVHGDDDDGGDYPDDGSGDGGGGGGGGDGGGDGGDGGDQGDGGGDQQQQPAAPKPRKRKAPPPPKATKHPMSAAQRARLQRFLRVHRSPFGWTALARHHRASGALSNAIVGAVVGAACAGWTDDEHVDRLLAIAGLCQGVHLEDIADVFGDDHAEAAARIGFDFGKVFHDIAPFASKALSFVPGIGPIASTALDVANQFIPSGGGGGGGGGGARPAQGPIRYAPGGGGGLQPGGVCLSVDQLARALAKLAQMG